MRRLIKINCDLGELPSNNDEAIMQYIHACSIACGGHAGDADSIHKSILSAAKFDLDIGAHPSYPDRENFGRLSMDISEDLLVHSLNEQLTLFLNICDKLQKKCTHIKAHGALYNDMHRDERLFRLFENVLLKLNFQGSIYMKSGCEWSTDLSIKQEVFLDRAYEDDHRLRSRKYDDSMLHAQQDIEDRLEDIVLHNRIQSINKKTLLVHADTLCIHSDTADSLSIAKVAHAYLLQHQPSSKPTR